jgi:Protein of unknown function (DUF1579)
MKNLMLAVCVAALFGSISAMAAQDAATPPMPTPQKEHEWLKQLEGQWTTEGECNMGPGQPAIKSTGTETGRMVGGFWAVNETKGEMSGMSMTGIMTVGYDPEKKKYVGTWVDSMSNYMWRYEGTVDAAGKTLTLNTEGPAFMDPSKKARYKEVIEFKSKDHKVFSSSIEQDGKWVTFMTMHAKRKK